MTLAATDNAIAKIDAARARRIGGTLVTDDTHSVIAEQNLLGSILKDPTQWQRLASVVTATDFYRPDHQLIWRTLAKMREAGAEIDAVTVSEYLQIGGELSAAGGLPYLASLARETAEPKNSTTYAEIVRSLAIGRELASLGESLSKPDADTPAERLTSAFRSLERMSARLTGDIDGEGWRAPRALENSLPAVEQFADDLLPDALRDWVTDVADRTQAPIEYVAVSAMVSLGAALGRKVAVRPKLRDDWTEFANLWGAVIGPPSWMKSPALDEGKRPLAIIEARMLEGFEDAHREWEAEAESVKVCRDGARDRARKAVKNGKTFDKGELVAGTIPEEPKPGRLIVNDATVPALCDVLRANPDGVLVFRDELAGLVAELEREGMEGSRGFYLTGWSGKDGHTQDRVARGTNIRVPFVCLSMLGGIQPARVAPILRESIATGGGDGFLARFSLAVWPDSPGEYRNVDCQPDATAREAAYRVYQRLHQLQPADIGAEIDGDAAPFLRLEPAAAEAFSEWDVTLRNRLRAGTDDGALTAHLMKYPKAVCALALLTHLADGGAGHISEPAVIRALAWAEFLESHARRIYASLGQSHIDAARSLLGRLKRGDLASPFSLRDVYRRGWAHLSDAEASRAAADVLESHHYLRPAPIESGQLGGRPTVVYHVNPAIRRVLP